MIILPTFEVREKLTAEKMNAFRDAVEAKFTGGITPADFAWPFVLQGDIDFADTYEILNLKTFWNLINAAEYTSLQLAVDAATAAGGGTVVIPPDTVIETNGVNLTGSLTAIMGFGPSSILRLSSGSSSGYFFQTATGGLTDIMVSNLAMDGQSTGTAQAGIIARRVNRFTVERVDIKNFTGPFIKITHDGAAGQSCQNVTLAHIRTSGGASASANHLKVEDCIGLGINHFFSDTCPTDAVAMEPTGIAGILRNITGQVIQVSAPVGKGISILGASATPDDKWSNIGLDNCQVTGSTGDAYELGTTSKLLRTVTMTGCRGPNSGAKALRVAAERGTIADNQFWDATGDGIDATNSINLWLTGNNCESNGGYGVNATSTVNCTVVGNNLRDSTTDGINRTTSTGLRAMENVGDDGPTVGNSLADFSSYARNGTGTGDMGFSYIIPPGTFKTGDTLKITLLTASTGNSTLELRFGATALSSTDNNTNTAQITYYIRPATGGANTNVTRIREQITPSFATANAAAVIDWTLSQTMTFNATVNAANTTINGIFIELLGAK